MTKDDLIAWRQLLGLSRVAAAERIGIHRNSLFAYEEGNAEIPLTVALACAAVAKKLKPWTAPK